jgi:hypothetical protein
MIAEPDLQRRQLPGDACADVDLADRLQSARREHARLEIDTSRSFGEIVDGRGREDESRDEMSGS